MIYMHRIALVLTFSFLLSSCVTEPDPINDGRILSGGSGKALERAYGTDPEFIKEPFDAVFYIDREFSSVIKYRCNLRAAFDAQGYVAYPESLTLNGIAPPSLSKASPGAFSITDTSDWGSDSKLSVNVGNFLHKDLNDSFDIAQPFKIREGWTEDTVLLGSDLVIRYDNVTGDTASFWSLTSLTDDPTYNGGSQLDQFTDNGTITIPAVSLAMLGENARFTVRLNRAKRTKIRTPSGLYIGVMSFFTEYAWYYLKKP